MSVIAIERLKEAFNLDIDRRGGSIFIYIHTFVSVDGTDYPKGCTWHIINAFKKIQFSDISIGVGAYPYMSLKSYRDDVHVVLDLNREESYDNSSIPIVDAKLVVTAIVRSGELARSFLHNARALYMNRLYDPEAMAPCTTIRTSDYELQRKPLWTIVPYDYEG